MCAKIMNCCQTENLSSYVESVLGHPYPTFKVFLTTLIIYTLILILGVLGNVCAIVSILRYSRKGCASNLYLLSLALSDLMLLCIGLPLELRDAVVALYPYSLPTFVCPSRAFLIEMSGNVSALTITAFSIQRWLAICFPLKARSAYRFRRTLKMVLGVWLLGALGATPVVFAVKINRLHQPLLNDEGQFMGDDYTKPILGTEYCAADYERPELELIIIHYSFWSSFVIPLILIIVLYIHVAVTIRKACAIHSPLLRQHKELLQRKSAVKMLVAVASAFFICWLPFHVQRLCIAHKIGQAVEWAENVYTLLFFTSGYFYYGNAVVNPLLYTMLSQRIREGVIHSFRKKSTSAHNFQGTDNDYTNSGFYNFSPLIAFRKFTLSSVVITINNHQNQNANTAIVIESNLIVSPSSNMKMNSLLIPSRTNSRMERSVSNIV